MKTRFRGIGFVLVLLTLSLASHAQKQGGIAPRSDIAGYPAYAKGAELSVGADLLTKDDVRRQFVSDLNRGYLVLETAVVPQGGASVKVVRGDFVLVLSNNEILRVLDPATVAGQLYKAAQGDRNITLYPVAGVGVETGRRTDPRTGQTQSGTGIYTSVGIGVGIGQAGAGTSDKDLEVMTQELKDKSLPDVETAESVAGYLYFPMPEKKDLEPVQLRYGSGEKALVLKLTKKS
jgi:hypothetical protein